MNTKYALCSALLLVAGLTGCKNTAQSSGDVAGGAVRGTGQIIQGAGEGAGSIVSGVGDGVSHVGQGVGKDLDGDKSED